MSTLMIRLLDRFRPREGWALLLLALAALLCAPAAVLEASDARNAGVLLVLTALGVVAGLWFARSRISARVAAVLSGLLGLSLATILVGRLLPPLSLLWRESGYTIKWLRAAREGVLGWPFPFASVAAFLWQRLNDLGVRLWWWGQTVASGGVAQEALAFRLLTAFLAWGLAFFAIWQIYRRRSVLLGLLPSGAAVAMVAFFRGGTSTFYLIAYLFCTLWLLAVSHLCTRRECWERTGTDYPGDLGLELIFALTLPLTVILVLAAFFPVIHPRQIRDTFWELMDRPWTAVEQASERLFGPIRGATSVGGGSGGSLPRMHLLGSGPELEEAIVFYVTSNDPPPPLPSLEEPEPLGPEHPSRYWRSLTYDTYTGRGWTNSLLEARTSPSDELIDPYLPSGFELYQHFELIASQGTLLHAVNAPLRMDHAVQTWWRAPGDLARVSSNASRYTVISRPPEPTIADLRAASPTLPPDLAERYLALPETIPQRVLDLAEQVTGDAETRYDQAHAIEFFLRTYTYTLDLPSPPTDRDLVDYFLFEQQEGYCDYYASAMVVLARAAGVPARFTAGFAQGTFDHDQKRWVVTEKDGHSWVEVYFDGIGWVEFEPTAGLPALTRTGSELTAPMVPSLPPRAPYRPGVFWTLMALGVVLVLLAAVVVWIWRPRQRRASSAAGLVRDRHSRLIRWGARLQQPHRDGQTPYEYAAALNDALQTRGKDSRWTRVRQASVEAPLEAEHLAGAFVRAQYSPEAITDREGWQIRDLWTRLRRRLWWLWLGGR